MLPAITSGDGLGPTTNGVASDMITVLYADPILLLDAAPLSAIASDGSDATVPNSIPINVVGSAVAAGDLILFSNALGNAIQQVTRVQGQQLFFAAGDSMNFNQRTAPGGTILQLKDTDTTYPLTTATRIIMVTYYLDTKTNPVRPQPGAATQRWGWTSGGRGLRGAPDELRSRGRCQQSDQSTGAGC